MLLPKDDADDGAAYLEIRAGAGGDEAAIFASDLFRMYSRFSERQGWKMEIVNSKPSEPSGIKEVVVKAQDIQDLSPSLIQVHRKFYRHHMVN